MAQNIYDHQDFFDGYGRLNRSVHGLDRAREMTSSRGILYRQEHVEQVKLSTEAYDFVYSSLTLHYIDNLSGLLKTAYPSLAEGG